MQRLSIRYTMGSSTSCANMTLPFNIEEVKVKHRGGEKSQHCVSQLNFLKMLITAASHFLSSLR